MTCPWQENEHSASCTGHRTQDNWPLTGVVRELPVLCGLFDELRQRSNLRRDAFNLGRDSLNVCR